jgi:hypothetical protein
VDQLRWYRAAATGVALVFLIFAIWYWYGIGFWPRKADFVSFWAAGRLALAGQPGLAYDFAAHHAAEQAVGRVGGLLPFPYPPPFLAIVAPFALLPYGPAFYLWVLSTAALFAWAAKRLVELPYAFAMPPAFINLVIGQTGFLMSGIFILGTNLIRTNQLLSGAVLGLLVLKPQLALLLPVATLAGREWRVIAGAMLCVSALCLTGLLLFGSATYAAFYETLPSYVGFMRDGRLPWNEMASTFAFGRYLGLPQNVALGLHAVVALTAAAVTARAWWFGSDQRVPILAAASLLIPPYLLTYDALLLILPIAWMLRNGYERTAAAAWLCCLSPVLSHFTPLIWPNLIPVSALICLLALNHSERSARGNQERDLARRVTGLEIGS